MKPEEIQKLAQTVKHLILDDIAVDVPPQRSDDDIYNALGEKFTDRTLRQMPKIVGISNIVDANDYQDTKGLNGFLTATMVNGVRRFIVTSANFSTFIGLTDTPSTYLGNSLKSIRIKADETGVEFVPAVDSDEKVKVSATDTSAEYLGATITTSGIAVKTITSPGTNEKLNIDVTIPAYTGDVTSSAGATVTAISSNAVTNSKLAQVPSLTFKGNATGATANVADLTVAQVKALLGIVTPASQLLYNQTNNLSVTNTTSPTALQNATGATGSLSIASNTLQAGDIVLIKMSGICSRVSGTWNITFTLGQIALSILAITPTTAVNTSFDMEMTLKVSQSGASGTIGGSMKGTFGAVQAYATGSNTIAAVPFNTTVSQALSATITMSAAAAGNSISPFTLTMELIK